MLKIAFISSLLFISSISLALDYSEIEDPINSGLRDGELKDYLHYKMKQNQTMNKYRDIKKHLFTNVDLEVDRSGQYFVEDVYCENLITSDVGPDSIPLGKKVNIEHTWPQSRFNNKVSKLLQKGDLHHLYIANSKANHERGNLPFAETRGGGADGGKCPASRIGNMYNQPVDISPRHGKDFFQPPLNHRGNVARALFYFATRYDLQIKNDQEYFLKKWHVEDPVDDQEILRNNRIFKIQKNRNLFIDSPELVNQISNF